jgi:hypothetical protein
VTACMDVKVKGLAANCGVGGWGAGSFEWINKLTRGSISDGKDKVKWKGVVETHRRNEVTTERPSSNSISRLTAELDRIFFSSMHPSNMRHLTLVHWHRSNHDRST